MRFLQATSLVTVLATVALGNTEIVEDVLISKRALSKRALGRGRNYDMSFYHINDVHAHLDQFRAAGTDCRAQDDCFGGYARVKTVIDEKRPKCKNSLFLNVGDEFQGTLFYSYYKGEKISETLNQLGFDAMTLGNHEFDGGDDELGEFLSNLTFPIVSANIQSTHPVLNKTIKPYHIYPKHKLAVIGVTTETTPGISNPGDGTTFSDSIAAVQRTIDHIRKTTNIKRIAAITHIGYEEDQKLAEQTTGLHLIMGGHSHTPLGNFTNAVGPYPTIRTNKDGKEVFIVTAYRWGEYLGYIDVTYAPDGTIISYRGAPIHLVESIPQDAKLQAQINAWREPFEAFAGEVLGKTNVVLEQSTCQTEECTLGDFMADAMLTYRRNSSSDAAFAIINAGGIRATIDAGDITRGDVLNAFPFGNSIVEFIISGQRVWDTLEGLVSKVNQDNGRAVTSFFQVSQGIKVEYDGSAAVGDRLVSVQIGGEDLDLSKDYTIVTLDFLAGGGDNIFSPAIEGPVTLDLQEEVLIRHVGSESPVDIELDGRITNVAGA